MTYLRKIGAVLLLLFGGYTALVVPFYYFMFTDPARIPWKGLWCVFVSGLGLLTMGVRLLRSLPIRRTLARLLSILTLLIFGFVGYDLLRGLPLTAHDNPSGLVVAVFLGTMAALLFSRLSERRVFAGLLASMGLIFAAATFLSGMDFFSGLLAFLVFVLPNAIATWFLWQPPRRKENSASADANAESFFVTGGTLKHDAASYVVRQADRDLFEGLSRGEFCYVLNTRQMGKSSLMVRTARRLREQGVAVAVLDLTAIGQNLSPEQWYDGLLTLLAEQLNLEDELEDFWRENRSLSPMQRFFAAVRQAALPGIENARPGGVPLVLFVDEIDAVRSLPFSTDEFFAGIRECYNRRTEDATMNSLAFCLLGVATPADLITDARTTPFNIGHRIELRDFTAEEARPLGVGLSQGDRRKTGEILLNRVLYWTGGHPYLTQRLCRALAETADAKNAADVDRLCEELFLSRKAQEKDDNLLFVRERILRTQGDAAGVLELYRQIRVGKRVPDDETHPLLNGLRLAGIVRAENGRMVVRNRIYARVFDARWVRESMPDAELRRQTRAFRLGVARTALVSGGLLAIIGGLAFSAIVSSHRAEHSAKLARDNETKAQNQAAEALKFAAEASRSEAKAKQLYTDLQKEQERSKQSEAKAIALANLYEKQAATERTLRINLQSSQAQTRTAREKEQKVRAELLARDQKIQDLLSRSRTASMMGKGIKTEGGTFFFARGDLKSDLVTMEKMLPPMPPALPGVPPDTTPVPLVLRQQGRQGIEAMRHGDFSAAIQLFGQGAEQAKKMKDPVMEQRFTYNQGIAYKQTGQLPEAVTTLKRAYELAKEVGNPQATVETQLVLSQLYTEQGNKAAAQTEVKQALALAKGTKSPELLAVTLNRLAALQLEGAEPDEAGETFNEVLVLQETLQNKSEISKALLGLGQIAKFQKKPFNIVTGYLEQAVSVLEKSGEDSQAAAVLRNLGEEEFQAGNRDKARTAFSHALSLYEKRGSQSDIAGIANNLGIVYDSIGQHEKAKGYHERALKIWEQLAPNSLLLAGSLSSLGGVYYNLGQPDTALKYYTRAETIYQKAGAKAGLAAVQAQKQNIEMVKKLGSKARQRFKESAQQL